MAWRDGGMGTTIDIGQGPARALRGATLALIIERGGHGYELAHRLGRRLGPTWQIDPKQIYPILDQFEKAGLATCTEESSPGRPRQARFVYHATDAAPVALGRWMRSPIHKEPLRADILARIAVSRPADAPQLLQLLDEYEAEVLALLEAAGEREPPIRTWATLLIDATRDHADAHLQAELAWIVGIRRRMREHAALG
jgi:DNA-binding PadR family transcriptional regulator